MILCLDTVQLQKEKPAPISVDDGNLIVSEGMAFQLLGQPYLVSQQTILHQPYSYEEVYTILEHQMAVSKQLNTACRLMEQSVTVGTSKETTKDVNVNTRRMEKFVIAEHGKTSLFRAKRICEESGWSLPEPSTLRQLQDLGQFLKQNRVKETFLGVTYDPKTQMNYLTNKGIVMNDQLFPGLTVILTKYGDDNEQKFNLTETADDMTAIYLITDEGKIRVKYNAPYHELDHGHLQRTERERGRIAKLDRIRSQLGSVACEKQYVTEPEQSTHSTRLSQALDKCLRLVAHYQDRRQVYVGQTRTLLRNYGLTEVLGSTKKTGASRRATLDLTTKEHTAPTTRPRDKRGIHTMLIKGLPLLSGALGAYGDYRDHKRIKDNTASIQQHREMIEENSLRLDTIGIDVQMIRTEQEVIKAAISDLKSAYSSLEAVQDIDNLLDSVDLNNREIERRIEEVISQLDHTLDCFMDQRIPPAFLRSVETYLESRDLHSDAVELRSHSPVIIDPEVHDRTINIYIIYMEGREQWDLYRLIPLPYFQNGQQNTPQLSYEYALVDPLQTRFAPLTEYQAHECNIGVCQEAQLIKTIEQDDCGINTMIQKTLTSTCPMIEAEEQVFIMAVPIGALYAVPQPIMARLYCDRSIGGPGVESEGLLRGVGTVQIPAGCDLKLDKPTIIIKGAPLKRHRRIDGVKITTLFDPDDLLKNNVRRRFSMNITSDWIEPLRQEIDTMSLILYLSLAVILILMGIPAYLIGFKVYRIVQTIRRLKNRTQQSRDMLQATVNGVTKDVLRLARLLQHARGRQSSLRRSASYTSLQGPFSHVLSINPELHGNVLQARTRHDTPVTGNEGEIPITCPTEIPPRPPVELVRFTPRTQYM